MATKKIEYKIELDADGAIKSTKELGEATEKVGETAEDAGKSLGKASVSLEKVALGAAAAYAAFKGVSAALADWERQAGIVNRFGGDVSDAAKRVNGLSSAVELMASRNAMAARGLELSAKDFGNFSVAVQEYAAATGKDAVQVTEEFGEALATGSKEGLNKFGVELGNVTTVAEGQQQAVAALAAKYGDAESSADTLAGSVGTLGNRLEDLKLELFSAAEAGFTAGDEIRKLNGEVSEGAGFWDTLTRAVGDSVSALSGFLKGALADAADFVIALESMGDVLSALVDRDFAKLKNAARNFGHDLQKAMVPDKAFAQASKAFDAYDNKVEAVAEKAETKFTKVAKAISSTGKAAKDAVSDFEALINAASSGEIDAGNLATNPDAFKSVDQRFAAQSVSDAGSGAIGAAAGAEGAVASTVDTVNELEQAFRDLYGTTDAAAQFAGSVDSALGIVQSGIADTINEVARGEKSMSDAMEQLAVNMIASLGEFLVQDGVKNVFLGLGRVLQGYGLDPTAVGLIAVGGAEIGAGVGMGAAAAAATPAGAGAGGQAPSTQPQEPAGAGSSSKQEPATIVVQYNAPMPKEQVGAMTDGTLRAAKRRQGSSRTRSIGG